MITPPKVLETERLRLRKTKLADAEVIFTAYANDPEVTKYVSWRAHRSAEETRAYVRACLGAWDLGRAFHWVIERKEDNQLLGMLIARVDGCKWELGFVLARSDWRRGYMTEILRRIIEYALRQEEVYRIWAVCDVDNLASARVMEKAGMQREGILRCWSIHPNLSSEPRDSYCYSITKVPHPS